MLELDKKLLHNKLKNINDLIIDFEALRESIKDLLEALKNNYPFDEVEVLYNEMVECVKTLNFEQNLFGWIFWVQTKFRDIKKENNE